MFRPVPRTVVRDRLPVMRLLLLGLALLPAAPQEAGDVTGTVAVAEGATPKKRLKLRYTGPGMEDRKEPSPSLPVVWLEGPPAAKADGKVVDMLQEGLEFRPRVLAIQAGTTVRFPNGDNVQHNVFSYSKARRFDLGRYPKGESKDVTFEQPGIIDVCCEVHEHMKAFIVVAPHAHVATAKEDGTFVLPKVPAGKHVLVAWKEGFEPVRREIEVGAGGAKVDVRIARAGDVVPAGTAAVGGCCAR
jgi:plastocyanin